MVEKLKQVCCASGLAGLLLVVGVACVSGGTATAPKKGGNGGILPGLFGGDKKTETPAVKETKPQGVRPTQLPIGTVKTVVAAEKFVLIRSSKALFLKPETEMMTYNQSGRPTSKLSLSPEKKGTFVVADIVQGNPKKGDRVVAMGMVDNNSRTTQNLVPSGQSGGGGDIQILE